MNTRHTIRFDGSEGSITVGCSVLARNGMRMTVTGIRYWPKSRLVRFDLEGDHGVSFTNATPDDFKVDLHPMGMVV